MPCPPPPFRQTFGVSPTILAGRDSLLESFTLGLAEGPGSPFRALLIPGARDMGKTVMLNEFEDAVADQGWVRLRAYPDASRLDTLINTSLPEAIRDQTGPGDKRMLTGVSITGIGQITTAADPDHSQPAPTPISRLRELAVILHQRVAGTDINQLHEPATAVQDLLRDDFDIALVPTGRPGGIETLLQHEGTTFICRAERIHLREVDHTESVAMLQETTTAGGRRARRPHQRRVPLPHAADRFPGPGRPRPRVSRGRGRAW